MTGKTYFEIDMVADSVGGILFSGTGEASILTSAAGGNNCFAVFYIGNGDIWSITRIHGNGGRNPTGDLTTYALPNYDSGRRRTFRVSTVGGYVYDGLTFSIRLHYYGNGSASSTWFIKPAPGRGA